jgi:hypothetical protein
MELYERVIESRKIAEELQKVIELKPPFGIGQNNCNHRIYSNNSFIASAANEGEAKQVADDLNAIWRSCQARRIDRLKRKFMEKFVDDGEPDHG